MLPDIRIAKHSMFFSIDLSRASTSFHGACYALTTLICKPTDDRTLEDASELSS